LIDWIDWEVWSNIF